MISVIAALRSGSRPIFRIYAEQKRLPRGFSLVRSLADERDVPISLCDRQTIEDVARGKRHGGLVATVGDRRYCSLPEILMNPGVPFVTLLDGVEDPYNFGQALRSLYAAGATGLLVRSRSWMSAAGIVARASAGASELLATAIAVSVFSTADDCVERGLTVFALDTRAERSIFEVDLTIPLLLLVGGEQRGIARSSESPQTRVVKIPYARPVAHSLGTAASVAVAAFEIMRQRSEQ